MKINFSQLMVCMLLLTSLRVSAQKLVPIKVAVYHALDNNLQVKQARFQAALAEQDVLQAQMNRYPSLDASLNGGQNWGLSFDQTAGRLVNQSASSASARLLTNVDLFTGFQRLNQIRANRYQLMADKSNVERVKNDLVLSVVTTYMEALTNQDLSEAASQQLDLSKRQLEAANLNFEVGNNTLADLSQAKSQVATDELNVTSAQNAFELSLLNLKQLMEMDPATDIALEKPRLPDVALATTAFRADEIYQQAVLGYPDIQQASFVTSVASKNIDIAKGGFYPTLSLSGGIGTSYSSQARDLITNAFVPFGEQLRRNTGESVGLSLGIPIFNNYRNRINVNKAKIGYENALASEQLAKNNLNKIVNQAVLDLRSAEKRYVSTETAFASAKDAFDVIQQRFNVGLANSVELFTAQTTMNKSEFDHIQARYDLLFRSKVIDFYLGNEINFEN